MNDFVMYAFAVVTIAAAVGAIAFPGRRRSIAAVPAAACAAGVMMAVAGSWLAGAVQAMAAAALLVVLLRRRAGAPEHGRAPAKGLTPFVGLIASAALGALLLTIVWTASNWRDAPPRATPAADVAIASAAAGLVDPRGLLLLALAASAIAIALVGASLRRDAPGES